MPWEEAASFNNKLTEMQLMRKITMKELINLILLVLRVRIVTVYTVFLYQPHSTLQYG